VAWAFRGLRAAASLKLPGTPRLSNVDPGPLPRPSGRGLIEAVRGTTAAGPRSPFRGLRAAASLKLRVGLGAGRSDELLPRPSGRGLIEAGGDRAPDPEVSPLPRPSGRGLIEASRTITPLDGTDGPFQARRRTRPASSTSRAPLEPDEGGASRSRRLERRGRIRHRRRNPSIHRHWPARYAVRSSLGGPAALPKSRAALEVFFRGGLGPIQGLFPTHPHIEGDQDSPPKRKPKAGKAPRP
jgi:hypothetical protein